MVGARRLGARWLGRRPAGLEVLEWLRTAWCGSASSAGRGVAITTTVCSVVVPGGRVDLAPLIGRVWQ